MPRIRVRKVKRKCNVIGCRCIDTYALTATSEYGSSVVICKGCLEAALARIDEGCIEGLPKAKEPAEAKNQPDKDVAENVTTTEAENEPEATKPKANSSVKSKKVK